MLRRNSRAAARSRGPLALALALLACTTASPPRVGMWMHPDLEIDEWICGFETAAREGPAYIHSKIRPSSWRQVLAHSSVVALNNFIFAGPMPWKVFQDGGTYSDYLARFAALDPETSPERQWLERMDQHLRAAVLQFDGTADPPTQKLIHIYAHMFGYDGARAAQLGLRTPAGAEPNVPSLYAWPPRDVGGSWPAAFLHDDDGSGPLRPRPSFKPAAAREAMANAVYFLLAHFASVGARVHLSPWREINGYASGDSCADCGLDSWTDLYAVYEAILQRVASGGFDASRIAVYPTYQLESFIGGELRCATDGLIDLVKQFYVRNAQAGVPYAIGLSTYPSGGWSRFAKHRSRLRHLLDNLDSERPVACDANGDGRISRRERRVFDVWTSVRVPRATGLAIGETSSPPWLSFQKLDAQSVAASERLGATMAEVHLRTRYRTRDRKPAYPLDYVVWALGPNWAFPVEVGGPDGARTWITTASGLARNWLSPMQPLAGQLVLDETLDPDGDWDNDGVANRRDSCPYVWTDPRGADPQADADGDGLGDVCDNCRNVPNYPQEDWDQDGFGNACDPDLDNDGRIQPEVDLAIVQQCQGAPIDCLARLRFPELPAGQTPPDLNGKVALIADLDADEDVDADDVSAWNRLASDPALRESGFACAGETPCPDPALVMLRNGETVRIEEPRTGPRTCTLAGR
jgi:hypothetical protein